MPIHTIDSPPAYKPDAVATNKGWVDEDTGEVIAAIENMLSRQSKMTNINFPTLIEVGDVVNLPLRYFIGLKRANTDVEAPDTYIRECSSLEIVTEFSEDLKLVLSNKSFLRLKTSSKVWPNIKLYTEDTEAAVNEDEYEPYLASSYSYYYVKRSEYPELDENLVFEAQANSLAMLFDEINETGKPIKIEFNVNQSLEGTLINEDDEPVNANSHKEICTYNEAIVDIFKIESVEYNQEEYEQEDSISVSVVTNYPVVESYEGDNPFEATIEFDIWVDDELSDTLILTQDSFDSETLTSVFVGEIPAYECVLKLREDSFAGVQVFPPNAEDAPGNVTVSAHIPDALLTTEFTVPA